jgi:thymidylate synthase
MHISRTHGSTAAAYKDLVAELRARDRRGSRAGEMRETLGAAVTVTDPRQRYVLRDDDWNLAFQLQEHWAYWAGANPGRVQRYNTAMKEWMVDGELPGSAYGDRLRNTAGHDQLVRVERQLRESPGTRRAIAMVHQPSVEDYEGGDVACTAHLQFFARDGELHQVAHLRSQDMYWGYTYDAANNQFLQEVLAERLGLELGSYRHVMGSCHYYTDFEGDVLDSASSARAAAGPELDLPEGVSWGAEFDVLTGGLSAARDARVDDALEAEGMLESRFCRDWLNVMVAYEFSRFHGDDDVAATFANRVESEDWGGWIRAYAGVDG